MYIIYVTQEIDLNAILFFIKISTIKINYLNYMIISFTNIFNLRIE